MSTPESSRKFDAIICDVDGCLQPEHHSPLHAHALVKIADHNRRAQTYKDRPVITLCTGRPIGYVEALCRLIANETLPVMAENGVWLWHPDTNTYARDPRITNLAARQVRDAVDWVRLKFRDEPMLIQPGKDFSFSLMPPSPAMIPTIEATLRAQFTAAAWPLRVSSTHLWINCDLDFVSKATAIDRFCAHTGLTKDRLAGIGDTAHDKAIKDSVAWFACPANATDAIKPHADYISPEEEIEGVLDIIERVASL